MIVLINGVSSSGKSTLCAALGQRLQGRARVLSLDEHLRGFRQMCATSYPDIPQDPASQSRIGELVQSELVLLFHSVAVGYSQANRLVVLDHVLYLDSWKQDFLAKVQGQRTLLVGLFCPEEELERRERLRKDREIGLWREQVATIHEGLRYDLEIDTATTGVAEGAQLLLDAVKRQRVG